MAEENSEVEVVLTVTETDEMVDVVAREIVITNVRAMDQECRCSHNSNNKHSHKCSNTHYHHNSSSSSKVTTKCRTTRKLVELQCHHRTSYSNHTVNVAVRQQHWAPTQVQAQVQVAPATVEVAASVANMELDLRIVVGAVVKAAVGMVVEDLEVEVEVDRVEDLA